MSTRNLLLLAALVIAIFAVVAWQSSHHRSADQEILIQKSHQH